MSHDQQEEVLRFSEDDFPPQLTSEMTPENFDEAAYLRAFPDVATAIAAGERTSAFEHFIEYGKRENRLTDIRYIRACADQYYSAIPNDNEFPGCSIDAVFVAKPCHLLIIGWVDDQAEALSRIEVTTGWKAVASVDRIPRCRRQDAEMAVGASQGKLLGFWCVIETEKQLSKLEKPSVKLHLGHLSKVFELVPQYVEIERLREIAFEYFANAQYFCNRQIESFVQINGPIGSTLVDLSVAISQHIISKACCLRFGPARSGYTGSIVVCLYGKAEFLFLQSAFFSMAASFHDYEFIYVSNSPELTETLQKEATIASRIYDVSISFVILPGNAGFGAANNVAVTFARSRRILIVNPDVFPRNQTWAQDHTRLIEELPPEQTAIFGVPLYYDDGSLMHSGMFFDSDLGLAIRPEGVQQMDMIRVEHYGKGAPPHTEHSSDRGQSHLLPEHSFLSTAIGMKSLADFLWNMFLAIMKMLIFA